jgi:cysteine-rich repeat protein
MTRPSLSLPIFLGAIALLSTACTSDEVTAEGGETSNGDGDGDPTGDGDGDPTGDGDGDPTGDGDGDPAGTCGDGTLDPGEACDDGNTEDGDGCSPTCQISACGLEWTWTEDVPSSVGGGLDVAVGSDGSVYVAGIAINADNDAWVAKWNPDGSQAWSESFDSGNGNDAANSIAVAADGTVYVVGSRKDDGDDQWVIALDDSGTELWSVTFAGDVAGADDVGTGVALAPDGDLVVVGRIRVGDGDDDVRVMKLDSGDGSELWSTTWSGTGDGNFSTDRSGAVAVADDGSVWVAAREHVDFDSQDATLLHFAADGSFIAAFQPQAGGDQRHDPIDVAVDGDAVYFAFEKSAFPYRGWLYKLDTAGTEAWVKTEADWPVLEGGDPIGRSWAIRGIGIDASGDLGLAGVFTNEEAGQGISWGEAWVAKLDGAGATVCHGRHQVVDGNVIPPSLSLAGGGFSSGGFAVTGIETAGQGNATKHWTGYFTP